MSGLVLTITTLAGSVPGKIVATAALMILLCSWVTVFGWKLTNEQRIAG
jgi:hypothetical protein